MGRLHMNTAIVDHQARSVDASSGKRGEIVNCHEACQTKTPRSRYGQHGVCIQQ